MSRKYTAQEMREMATEAEVIEVPDQFYGRDMDTIAAMLRQAADMMDRKKQYEYSWMIETGEASLYNRTPSLDVVKMVAPEDATIVRREVGEWIPFEEVSE